MNFRKDRIITNIVNYTNRFPWKFRKLILYKTGVCGGSSKEWACDIRKGIYFDNIYNVELGKNVMINQNVHFYTGDASAVKVKIANNVYVGMNTNFICVTHLIGNGNQRAGDNIYNNIEIGLGAWIGANVLVLPGVHIGEGCIIAAGSVVISNCEKNCLYAGNPAVKKKKLN